MMKAMPFGLNIGYSTIITVKSQYHDQRVSMSDLWEHIDLCSGIGGFSLGFQWAELSEPILFCELDEFCQKILKKHWPDVTICNDVKELANDTNAFIPRPRGRKRILTAGYPCQPFSQAGQRRGTEDPRHIWPYILRIIQQERPNVCVFENVSGHISLGLDEVLHDLEGEGYTTRTFVLPAEACGASHRRDRLWIIARNMGNANDNGSSATEIRRSNEETARGSQEGQIKTEQSQGTSGRENHDDVADTKSISRDDNEINKKHGEIAYQIHKEMFPTPTANEDAAGRPGGKMQKMLGNHPEVRNKGEGTLNADWVEWLMGYPRGWTSL
jgi:DNA-cytosine methyltransferase